MRHFFTVLLISSFILASSEKAGAQAFPDNEYGPYDTIITQAIFYDGEWMPYSEMEMFYISNVSKAKMAKILKEYNRLRNAVYVTYPYARTAGAVCRLYYLAARMASGRASGARP
ncbi:MAG: hypothetical protein ACXWCZ_11815 [Flavisolibacter sp.]